MLIPEPILSRLSLSLCVCVLSLALPLRLSSRVLGSGSFSLREPQSQSSGPWPNDRPRPTCDLPRPPLETRLSKALDSASENSFFTQSSAVLGESRG